MMAAPAMAGNGKGSSLGQGGGDRTRTQTRSQLKDGSCRDAIEVNEDLQLLTADKLRIKDMMKLILQDGTCQDEEA